MALLHAAELVPSKLDLIEAWLPGRPWFDGATGFQRIAAFRFDDPSGEVGIETLLVRAGDGPIYQVPLTYRGAPLEGADSFLVGTMDHSVLGPRWAYDACGDPVYVNAIAAALGGGITQADEYIEINGEMTRRDRNIEISVEDAVAPAGAPGTLERVVDGDPTLIVTDTMELSLIRNLSSATPHGGARLVATHIATLPSHPTPLVLAFTS
jgi:hypothetical protein